MAKRSTTRANVSYGPQATYAWLVSEALAAVHLADRNDADGGRSFHAAMNDFLALTAADTGYYSAAWVAWQRRVFKNPDGSLPTRLTKAHRRIEEAMAVSILRRAGVFGYKDKPFSDDHEEIARILAGRDPTPDEVAAAEDDLLNEPDLIG